MASILCKPIVATVMTGLVLIGVRLGAASEQAGSVVSRRQRPESLPTNRIRPGSHDVSLPPWPFDSHVQSSEDRLVNALRKVIADPAHMSGMRGRARASYERRYSPTVDVQRLEAVYAELIG